VLSRTRRECFEGAEVFDLAQTPDGAIWVATGVGVVRLPPDATD